MDDMAIPFASPRDHLLVITDLGRMLAGRLAFVQASRRGETDPQGRSRPHDLAREVARQLGGPADPEAARASIRDIDLAIEAAFGAFMERLAATVRTGRELPFSVLTRTLGLSRVEQRIVIALAAAELDPELERAFTIAFDEPRRRLDVGWLSLLLGGLDFGAREEVIAALAANQPLQRRRLVLLGEGPQVFRTVRLADRLVALLRGDDSLDETVAAFCQEAPPRLRDELVIGDEVIQHVTRALAFGGFELSRVMVVGPDGIGKAALVEMIATSAERVALRVDLALALALTGRGRIADAIGACGREAALRNGVLVLDAGALSSAELDHEVASRLTDALRDVPVPVAIVTPTSLRTLLPLMPELVEVAVPAPSYRERSELWRRALGEATLAPSADIDDIAGRYSFGGAAIVNAARRARTSARLRDPERPAITTADLVEAARTMFSHRLGTVAQRIPAGFTWDDLVLPPDTLEQIREVTKFARRRAKLLEEWGFARKLPYGRGISAILAGPPGTGKTMVAQLLAHELGYDLYRIDLSQVVNKYVGETEKSLARIFAEAENSHAVLFFDEADALFAKRTDVKSANDRYANLEVNYLLQRMETFDGVTLLATNLEQGLDEAFKRRVRFTIGFELPDESVRAALWRSMVPNETPTARDIDWDVLGEKFEMSGGYIKKAALRAALAAVDENRPLRQDDLVKAGMLEYREMGRVIGS